MAHELGHWAHTDVLRMLIAGQITIGITLSCLGVFLFDPAVYRAFGFGTVGVGSKLPYIVGIQLVSAIIKPLDLVVQFAVHALSRNREFAADRFAVELGYGDELSRGLIRLMGDNKALIGSDWLYSAFHHSHPTLPERLGAIETTQKRQARKTK